MTNIDSIFDYVKPNPAITLTEFPNLQAKSKREICLGLNDYAARLQAYRAGSKADLPLISGCRFGENRTDKGCLRHDTNVIGFSAVVAEHDAGVIPFDQALLLLKTSGIVSLVYTTPSHRPDRPRWRVIVPLASEHPPHAYGGFVDRLNGILQGVLAGESWTASQAFYCGFVEGAPDQRIEVIQ